MVVTRHWRRIVKADREGRRGFASPPSVATTIGGPTALELLERLTGGGIMSHAQQILETHPRTLGVAPGPLVACIDACFDCAQSCTACADADLGEPDVETMIRCIALCHNCSDICISTGRVLSRQTEFVPEVARVALQACIEACRLCGDECERHAQHHEHCRICEEVCRICEQACDDALKALPT